MIFYQLPLPGLKIILSSKNYPRKRGSLSVAISKLGLNIPFISHLLLLETWTWAYPNSWFLTRDAVPGLTQYCDPFRANNPLMNWQVGFWQSPRKESFHGLSCQGYILHYLYFVCLTEQYSQCPLPLQFL